LFGEYWFEFIVEVQRRCEKNYDWYEYFFHTATVAEVLWNGILSLKYPVIAETSFDRLQI
jgi:hypothetical protein